MDWEIWHSWWLTSSNNYEKTLLITDNFIPKEFIDFVRDPLTVKAGADFSSEGKKMIPLLDDAALEMELRDFQ